MRLAVLLAPLLVTGASCQFILGIEDVDPVAAVDADPGPDAQPGAPDAPACALELVAAKVYSPEIAWCDASVTALSQVLRFSVPQELMVTGGEPGGHCARLRFDPGYLDTPTECIYKGNFGTSYVFSECRYSTGTIDFDDCGGTDTGEIAPIMPGDLRTVGQLTLHIDDGTPTAGRTEVTLTLPGVCPEGVSVLTCDSFGL